jgi:hypothetical protein
MLPTVLGTLVLQASVYMSCTGDGGSAVLLPDRNATASAASRFVVGGGLRWSCLAGLS